MCGHIGLISAVYSNSNAEFFEQGLIIDTLRGWDGTGMALLHAKSKDVSTLKQAVDGFTFIANPKVHKLLRQDKNWDAYLGHNRYATSKHLGTEHAHPFRSGNITLLHNGVIRNASDLAKEHNITYTVDSELACKIIAKEGIEEACKLLRGAYAFVWVDERDFSVNFIRNYERPLHVGISQSNTKLIYASELEMLKLLTVRNKMDSLQFTYEQIPVGEHWKVPIDGAFSLSVTKTKVDISPKSTIVPHAANTYRAPPPRIANSVLETLGIKVGEDISVYPDNFVPYRTKTDEGKLVGTLADDPWCMVEIHGVYRAQAEEWLEKTRDKNNIFTLIGPATSGYITAAPEEDPVIIIIRGSNCKTNLEPVTVEENKGKNKKKTQLVLPEQKITPTHVLGKGGKLITTKEYLRQVCGGCADCGRSIGTADSSKIIWLEAGGVMCPECVHEWEQKYPTKVTH